MGTPGPEFYLHVRSGLSAQSFPVATGAIAGRGAEATIRLEHAEVSRQHCRFDLDGEEFVLTDLGSKLGTRVNGAKVGEPVRLSPGDLIEIGPVRLVFGPAETPSAVAPAEIAAPLVGGRETLRIPLQDRLVLGRDPECSVLLKHTGVSRRHLEVRQSPSGWKLVDLKSTAGAFVNGQRFDELDLVYGDRLQIGPYDFEFDGQALAWIAKEGAGAIDARAISYLAGNTEILREITLGIPTGSFAGIIGPSGAGKSSLLQILSGLRTATVGQVLVGGERVGDLDGASAVGFVPQEDIVHPELTVSEALRFAALLRLPASVPPMEVHKLVLQTMRRLGIIERANTRVHDLSGGQRKRVSVGAELLAKPSVLFLDEPTSGLDPATEFKLMELLRDLADGGCTIVATTHVMENVYLVDQLLVLMNGRLVFSGTPDEARNHFGIQRLSGIYERLDLVEKEPDQAVAPASAPPARKRVKQMRRSVPGLLSILLQREWAILRSDRRNFAMLLGQPLLVGALVSWVSNDAALILFFAYVAALWFGCSNGAQEIVGELPVYRRERVVGVGRNAYLLSKMTFVSVATLFQAMLLYLAVQVGEGGLAGTAIWQVLALAGISIAGSAVGCAISALSRSLMQAVLAVPLLLIPLILLSGHPVPAYEMRPAVFAVSRLTPAFSAQQLVDVSFLWKQELARTTLSDFWTSFRNVNRDGRLKTGEVYRDAMPAVESLGMLGSWAAVGYLVAAFALRRREKE